MVVLYYGSCMLLMEFFFDLVGLCVVVFFVGYCNCFGYLYWIVLVCYEVCGILLLCIDCDGVVWFDVVLVGGGFGFVCYCDEWCCYWMDW